MDCRHAYLNKNNKVIKTKTQCYERVVCISLQNKSACCAMLLAQSCSPPGAAADPGQSAGREVRGLEKSQTLGSLGRKKDFK